MLSMAAPRQLGVRPRGSHRQVRGLAWLGRPKSSGGASISRDSPRPRLQGPSQGQIQVQELSFSGNLRAPAAPQVRI